MIVTYSDLRACGFCSKGARAWFKHYDIIDWLDFAKNGVDAEILLNTGDALANRAVEQAKLREQNGRR